MSSAISNTGTLHSYVCVWPSLSRLYMNKVFFFKTGSCVVLSCRPQVYIEQKALDTIAHLCDGDARAGLNGLQLAVQARVTAHRAGMSDPSRETTRILIQEEHVKEGLQRSHILYDKAGELLISFEMFSYFLLLIMHW